MNMKRTAVVCLCACMAFAFAAGCKKLTPPIDQHVTTLQGTIFNAITGERIGGTDVAMYLQQGTLTRTPDVFYTGVKVNRRDDNTTMDLMGDYAFARNIPSADILLEGGGEENFIGDDIHPNEYRITVIKDGFQRFEGIIGNLALTGKDNVIKNIYLFPEDYLIPCYTYTAKI